MSGCRNGLGLVLGTVTSLEIIGSRWSQHLGEGAHPSPGGDLDGRRCWGFSLGSPLSSPSVKGTRMKPRSEIEIHALARWVTTRPLCPGKLCVPGCSKSWEVWVGKVRQAWVWKLLHSLALQLEQEGPLWQPWSDLH